MYYYQLITASGICHYRKSKKAIRNLKDAQQLNGANGIIVRIKGITRLRYYLYKFFKKFAKKYPEL